MSKPGQAIVIVGGASGIGEATVRMAVKRKLKVVIGDMSEARGKALEAELSKEGHTCAFVPINITDSTSIDQFIAKSVELYGRIDFAVNTAGYTGQTVEGHLLGDEEYHRIMSIDVEGAWRFTKAFVKYFRSLEPRLVRHDIGPYWNPVTQRGSIVLVASSLGSEGKEHLAAYCAAKHAVIGMMKTFALENATWGIRVNCVSPGLCMTPILMNPGFDIERAKKVYLTEQPVLRFGHPDEQASGILFTVLDTASFMTGTDWGPDGGSHVA